jgi:undecaprenyl pyrophosphate phosphatase UppP
MICCAIIIVALVIVMSVIKTIKMVLIDPFAVYRGSVGLCRMVGLILRVARGQ